jgi:hypothetical protein
MSKDYGICSMLHSSCNEFTPRGQWTLTLGNALKVNQWADVIWDEKRKSLWRWIYHAI